MKRSILFTALAALLVATSCVGSDTSAIKKEAPKRQNWDTKEILYGDVDSVTIIKYKMNKNTNSRVLKYSVYKFNIKGDVVEVRDYLADGTLWERKLYKYDSQGNSIEEIKYNADGLQY